MNESETKEGEVGGGVVACRDQPKCCVETSKQTKTHTHNDEMSKAAKQSNSKGG